jgi:hypothetical protein
MYLKKLVAKNKLSLGLNKIANKKFSSFFANFNKETLAFRATKYDPTKQLEVKIKINNFIRIITLLNTLKHLITLIIKSQNYIMDSL